MKILIIQHVENEDSGTIGDFFKKKGDTLTTIHLYNGDTLPNTTDQYDVTIIMGGPMNVDDEDIHPYLKEEKEFIKKLVFNNKPVLGICLGAQLIARACGASVLKANCKEVGWYKVNIIPNGKRDAIFKGVNNTIDVLHWHSDTFMIPNNATHLISGDKCPNQGFRINNAYGFQFHIEVNVDIIADWFKDTPYVNDYIEFYKEIESSYVNTAETIYNNFYDIVCGM